MTLMIVPVRKQNGDSVFVRWSSQGHRHVRKRCISAKFTSRCSRKIALPASIDSFD